MNLEQYTLLQYIIRNRLKVRKANVLWHNWLCFLIDLYHVGHLRSCEGNDKVLILFKMVGIVPILWLLVLCWYIWRLNVTMVFEFLHIHRDRIPQHCARYWDTFLQQDCSSKIYMYIRAVSSYSLWYLVPEIKVNLHIWICCNIPIFTPECWII